MRLLIAQSTKIKSGPALSRPTSENTPGFCKTWSQCQSMGRTMQTEETPRWCPSKRFQVWGCIHVFLLDVVWSSGYLLSNRPHWTSLLHCPLGGCLHHETPSGPSSHSHIASGDSSGWPTMRWRSWCPCPGPPDSNLTSTYQQRSWGGGGWKWTIPAAPLPATEEATR